MRDNDLPNKTVATGLIAGLFAGVIVWVCLGLSDDRLRSAALCGFAVAVLACTLSVFMSKSSNRGGGKDFLSKDLSAILFGATLVLGYLCLLAITLYRANGTKDDVWTDIYRNGFVLLGGTVTTVVGYYFGSKGADTAQANAIKKTVEAEQAKAEVTKILEDKAPTDGESDLEEA